MRHRFPAAVLLALAGASGLSAQDTVVVRAENRPEWGTRPRVMEEMRLGVLQGDERHAFGRAWDVALGDDDDLWVADAQANRIRIFDDRGRARDPVGRPGEGPGEFARLGDVEPLAHGGMAAWDQGLLRVSIFNDDGSFLKSFPVPADGVAGGATTLQASVTGDVWVATLGEPPGTPDSPTVWLRMSEDGQVVNALAAPRRSPEGPADFAVTTEAAMSPRGYLVQGRGDRWAVTRPLEGLRVLRIERSTEPVAFGWAERREAESREAFLARRRGVPPAPIPRVKPVFKGLQVDQEGRIWVRLHADAVRIPRTPGEEAQAERARERSGDQDTPPPREWRERAVYDVVEEDGRFLGTVEVPYWNSRMVAAKGRRFWVIQTGDRGETYVVQYRVVPGN